MSFAFLGLNHDTCIETTVFENSAPSLKIVEKKTCICLWWYHLWIKKENITQEGPSSFSLFSKAKFRAQVLAKCLLCILLAKKRTVAQSSNQRGNFYNLNICLGTIKSGRESEKKVGSLSK